MPNLTLLPVPTVSRAERESLDPVRQASRRLAHALPMREDTAVLVDFIEDDLREGLTAVAEVEAHFTDLLDFLRGEPLLPIGLLDVAEDHRVMQRVEDLELVVANLRKRMQKAAALLREKRR